MYLAARCGLPRAGRGFVGGVVHTITVAENIMGNGKRRILGHIRQLQGEGHDVPMHVRQDLAFIAAHAVRSTREHAKQFMGTSTSRCAYITRG